MMGLLQLSLKIPNFSRKLKNMNNKVLLIYFFFLSIFSFSNERVDDRYSISILTVSPGKDLADAFGHSGIRVIDRELNYDIVFNLSLIHI